MTQKSPQIAYTLDKCEAMFKNPKSLNRANGVTVECIPRQHQLWRCLRFSFQGTRGKISTSEINSEVGIFHLTVDFEGACFSIQSLIFETNHDSVAEMGPITVLSKLT